MLTYILRRLLLMIPTLIGITFVIFLVMALSPGGVGAQFLDSEVGMRPEEREAMRKYLNDRYGLDKPMLVQYCRWLNHVSPLGFRVDERGRLGALTFKKPDLGESFVLSRPVIDVVAEALPITLLLNLLTVPIIYAIAITAGIYAAQHRGKSIDVGVGVVFLGLWSIPVMWTGVMALGFLCNRDYLHWFPTSGLHDTLAESMAFLPHFSAGGFERGWLLDMLWHLVLPVLCLTYGGFAFLTKLMRASVLENLSADFARTARAKGVSERHVLFRHVMRNSLLPLITIAASILPGLLGGSIIVETIFSIHGMGRVSVEAIFTRDRELVLSTSFVASVLSLLSMLASDICYAIADPRVSYE